MIITLAFTFQRSSFTPRVIHKLSIHPYGCQYLHFVCTVVLIHRVAFRFFIKEADLILWSFTIRFLKMWISLKTDRLLANNTQWIWVKILNKAAERIIFDASKPTYTQNTLSSGASSLKWYWFYSVDVGLKKSTNSPKIDPKQSKHFLFSSSSSSLLFLVL